MDMQTFARPYHLRAHGEQSANFAPRSAIQVPTHDVSLQNPGVLQTNLRSLDASYRENVRKQMCGCEFAFPCQCGTS